MFDLYLLTLNISAGKEQPGLPGLLVTPAPRRCERSRSGDLLLVHASFSGAPLPEDQLQEILEDTAGAYFSARGSVTAGLRVAVEDLNDLLLNDNLKNPAKATQRTAVLNLAVLRRETIYLAQAGQTRAILLGADETQIFGESPQSSRALGLSRNITIQFHQSLLHPKDLLLLCSNPPASWNAQALAGSSQLTFDQLRRRLLSQAGEELQAAAVQFQAGKGEVHHLKPRISVALPAAAAPGQRIRAATPPAPAPTAPVKTAETRPPAPAPPPEAEKQSPEKKAEETQSPAGEPAPSGTVSFVPPRHPAVEELVNPDSFRSNREARKPAPEAPRGDQEHPPRRGPAAPRPAAPGSAAATPAVPGARQRSPHPSPGPRTEQPDALMQLRKKLASLWFSGKTAGQQVRTQTHTFAGRLLPVPAQRPGTLPVSTLLFIAIAVPLVIAAIATTIYTRSGWKEQHYLYLQEAQKSANQAMAQSDPILQGNLWKQSQEWVEKAEKYGTTDESRTLHLQVQQAVDRMEGVLRLELVPALAAPFSADVSIKDIAVSDNGDIYLLNQTSGSVIRMFVTARGYQVDSAFKCGPGSIGTLLVGPLVDMVSLDFSNRYNATILAADAQGALLYCMPGEEPISRPLPETAGAGWSNITSIARDAQLDSLYVADTGRKMIAYFDGDRSTYDQEAHNAFDNYVPAMLDQTVDIALNEDLFILYSNGRLAWCTQRSYTYAAAECEDPAAFGDTRPNRTSDVAIFPNAKFVKLFASQPPDPALYIIEQSETSLYLFSLKLNLQYLLRPQYGTLASGKPLTAFAIAPGRVGVLAFGNEVYSAALP